MNMKGLGAIIIVACMLLASVVMVMPAVDAGKPTPPPTVILWNTTPEYDGWFGWSVATDSTFIVVGASGETSGGFAGAGNVYVYYKSGVLATTLTSPNAEEGGHFGYSVAIVGGCIVVGAPGEFEDYLDAGHAYIYKTSDLTAAPIELSSTDRYDNWQFGYSVTTDGTYVVVGSPFQAHDVYGQADGLVYLFQVDGTFIGSLSSPDIGGRSNFGRSLAMTQTHLIVGAPIETVAEQVGYDQGAVYIYSMADLTATPVKLISANPSSSGRFGDSVAINGRTIVVGASQETSGGQSAAGNVYVFSTSGRLTKSLVSLNPTENGGFGKSVGFDGRKIIIGAPYESAESLSGAGTLVGAGHAYVFTSSGRLIKSLMSEYAEENGEYGLSVAIGGGQIIIGAPYESPGGESSAGRVYITA